MENRHHRPRSAALTGNTFRPSFQKNYGKWKYHEILEPGVLVHVSETGDKVFTVRVGGARLMTRRDYP